MGRGRNSSFYYERKAETSVGWSELLVLTRFLTTLFYYFTLQVLFFLTQYGEEGGQEDDNNVKRMENIRNSRKRREEEEINHQNFITLDCLTGEQRKKTDHSSSACLLIISWESLRCYTWHHYNVCAVNLNLYYFFVPLQSYTQVSSTDKPCSVSLRIVLRIILIANDYNSLT